MRVLISGYYGFGNGGDEALLMSLLQMLPAHVEPVILSQSPEITEQIYSRLSPSLVQHLEARPRMDGLSLLQGFRSVKAFIWGGGSLLQDATSWRSPLYYLGLMAWAQRLGLTTVAWAQGIGPLRAPWNRRLAQQVLSGCTVISVRDQPASKLLSQWNIQHQRGPDPVWALQPKILPAWSDRPHPHLALILRTHPALTWSRLQPILQALNQIQQTRQAWITFLPFQQDPHTGRGADVELAQTLQSHLQPSTQVMQLQDPQLLRGFLTGIDLVITMRFHGLVMGAAAGCRCFSLSYDPKVKTLAEELKMPVWELKDIPADPEVIYQAWLQCLESGVRLSSEAVQSWAQTCHVHTQILQDHLSPKAGF